MTDQNKTDLADGTFLMGDAPFHFPKKGIKAMGEWKNNHLKPLLDLIFELREVDFAIDLSAGADIGELIGQFQPLIESLVDLPQKVLDAVTDWLEPSDDEKRYLEEDVPLEEFMPPLKWIVGQIFPLAGMISSIGGATGTGKRSNLPARNGAGKKKKSGKKK